MFMGQYRMFLVYGYFFVMNIITLAAAIRNAIYTPEWEDNYSERITCINYIWFQLSSDDFSCCYEQTVSNPKAMYIIPLLMLAGSGFYLFMILGFRKITLIWLKLYFHHIITNHSLFPPSEYIKSSSLQPTTSSISEDVVVSDHGS